MKKITETINRIIEGIKSGEVGAYDATNASCVYDDSYGHYCAIGYLMSPEQRERVSDAGLNDNYSVNELIEKGYFDPAEFGLNIDTARQLQDLHDGHYNGEPLNETAVRADMLADFQMAAVLAERGYPDINPNRYLFLG